MGIEDEIDRYRSDLRRRDESELLREQAERQRHEEGALWSLEFIASLRDALLKYRVPISGSATLVKLNEGSMKSKPRQNTYLVPEGWHLYSASSVQTRAYHNPVADTSGVPAWVLTHDARLMGPSLFRASERQGRVGRAEYLQSIEERIFKYTRVFDTLYNSHCEQHTTEGLVDGWYICSYSDGVVCESLSNQIMDSVARKCVEEGYAG